jgi:hypothetical protein
MNTRGPCFVVAWLLCVFAASPAGAADVGVTIRLWRLFTPDYRTAYLQGFLEGAWLSGAECRRPYPTIDQIIQRTDQWINQRNMPPDGLVGVPVSLAVTELGCSGIGPKGK